MSVFIDGYEIDVTLSEEHFFDNEVTEHPVERGADVTDHVRARPVRITLEGLVSDTPIGDLAIRRKEFTLINGEAFALPSDESFARLLAIRDAREPVTIETSLRSFDDMMLESLTVPRTPQNGDALRFRATFVQVQFVTNDRTTIRVAVPRAAKKVNLGNRGAPADGNPPPPYLLNDDAPFRLRALSLLGG